MWTKSNNCSVTTHRSIMKRDTTKSVTDSLETCIISVLCCCRVRKKATHWNSNCSSWKSWNYIFPRDIIMRKSQNDSMKCSSYSIPDVKYWFLNDMVMEILWIKWLICVTSKPLFAMYSPLIYRSKSIYVQLLSTKKWANWVLKHTSGQSFNICWALNYSNIARELKCGLSVSS